MAILKTGKVNLSATITRSDFYMAMSIDTGSGFTVPYPVYNIEQLTSYFGEDFPQRKLCEKLLDNTIPILVLPVLSHVSWANKSSLKICELTGTRAGELFYCHPRLEKESGVGKVLYDKSYLDNLKSSKVYDKSSSFCLMLDLTNVTLENTDEYFIVPYLDENLTERLLLFTFKTEFPIEEDYYDDKVERQVTNADEIINCVIENSKSHGFKVIKISEYLSDLLHSYNDTQNQQFYPTIDSSSTPESNYQLYNEYLEEYINYLLNIECYLDNWGEIIDQVEKLLTIESPDSNGNIYYMYGSAGEVLAQPDTIVPVGDNILNRLSYIISQYSKVILLEYPKLVNYYRTNHLTGLVTSKLGKYNERVVTTYSSNIGLFEVHSKIKGPKANEIKVRIERYEFLENSYIVTIYSNEREELYYINADLSVDLESLGLGFSRIQVIDEESQLVTLKVCDYVLSDGTIADKRFIDFTRDNFIDYEERNKNINNNPGKEFYAGELQIVNLLPSKFDTLELSLDNAVDEKVTFSSRKNNIATFRKYDYYPDFFLEDIFLHKNLWSNRSEEELQEYLDDIYNYVNDKFSQALVNMNKEFLERGNTEYPQLATTYSYSRILKFYNTITIDSEKVCSFYPYIINFLQNEFLALISDDIISQITLKDDEFFAGNSMAYESAKKKLIKAKLNFIECDNLNYYYTNIREPFLDPSFIIRYCISKLSREVLINESALINCQRSDLDYTINTITSRVTNLITLIDSLSFSYTLDKHAMLLEFSMTLPKISNQTYVINITLNY